MSLHDYLTVMDKQLTQYPLAHKVKMEDDPRFLSIPKSECPDIWIRLPQHSGLLETALEDAFDALVFPFNSLRFSASSLEGPL